MNFLEKLTNKDIETFFVCNGYEVEKIMKDVDDVYMVKTKQINKIASLLTSSVFVLTNFKVFELHEKQNDLSDKWYGFLRIKFGKKYIVEHEKVKNKIIKNDELSK